MTQAVIRRHLTAKTRVQSRPSGGRSNDMTAFFSSTSALPCQPYSSNVPYPFTHHRQYIRSDGGVITSKKVSVVKENAAKIDTRDTRVRYWAIY